MHEVTIFNEKRPGQKVIFAGPFIGSWTHHLILHIPIVNRLREENPDAYIVSGGYIGEHYWYQTDKRKLTIDAYVGYASPSHTRRVFGLRQRKYDDDVYRFQEIAEKYFGPMEGGFIQPDVDSDWVNNVVGKYKRTAYRIGTYAPEPVDNEPHIVLHGRPFYRFQPNHLPIPDAYSHDNPHWQCTDKIIKLLAQHYRVYITGLKNECYEFDTGGKISSLIDMPTHSEPALLTSLVNTAECVVCTMGCALSCFGLFVGCPVVQFNTKKYASHLSKWNPFETCADWLEAGELDAQWRYDYIMRFIQDSKKQPRYKHDIIRQDDNLKGIL